MSHEIIEMPLRRLSICPCGGPVLKEEITLGTVYKVDLHSKRGGFSYFCGHCEKWQYDVVCINATSMTRPDSPMLPIPMDLFITPEAS